VNCIVSAAHFSLSQSASAAVVLYYSSHISADGRSRAPSVTHSGRGCLGPSSIPWRRRISSPVQRCDWPRWPAASDVPRHWTVHGRTGQLHLQFVYTRYANDDEQQLTGTDQWHTQDFIW